MEIAFLGTGIMGLPMARNIAAGGEHVVRAWNRTKEKAEPLREDGVEVVEGAQDAVRGADVVVTMLADGPATLEVAAAMLPHAGADTVWWQAGTVGLQADRELAAMARSAGVAYVDGPVLGTKQPAEQGELVVLSAGPPAARHRCEPLFEAVGRKTVFLGEEPGAGSRLKLVLNHWIAALTAATADTILLARALGVDPQVFLDTIAGGPLDADYAQLKGGAMIAGAFSPPSFPLSLAAKDVRLVLEAASASGLELALAPGALARFEAAEERGHGGADMAAVILGA
ncbi:MAG: NAD(P)-dependent oxidoreductase [Solirubrobacterales bacterium]|nr:NAD(P)-dependent oxidoreductase [Solirubrobacterales bacterium]